MFMKNAKDSNAYHLASVFVHIVSSWVSFWQSQISAWFDLLQVNEADLKKSLAEIIKAPVNVVLVCTIDTPFTQSSA